MKVQVTPHLRAYSLCDITMSLSDSDSGSELPEDMLVRLVDIKTIGQLFQTGVLKAAVKHRYDANPGFLDRVSLL